MNKLDRFIGEDRDEVEAAFAEEDCSHCFDCPHATPVAASLTHRTGLALRNAAAGHDNPSDLDEEITQYRNKLRSLTTNCGGYSNKPRESGAPAGMCDSPSQPDPKVARIAGKFLEVTQLYRLPIY